MSARTHRIPSWLLTVAAGVGIFWCVIAVVATAGGGGGVRPLVRLGTFTYDPSAGSLPWRLTLHEPATEALPDRAPGQIEAVLSWRRRSNAGLGAPIFRKRFEFVLVGDAPPGVAAISPEDAQSLVEGAYATLPADNADRRTIFARNEFLRAITPGRLVDELDLTGLAISLSVPVAVIGTLLSLRALGKRKAESDRAAAVAA